MKNVCKTTMKSVKGKIIVLTFILAAVLLLGPVGIHHASAFEMTWDINNNSGSTATVEVYAKTANETATLYGTFTISNNGTQTATFLSLTNKCPSYLKGKVGNSNIVQMTCSGTESTSTTERCCANLTFKVYKKSNGTYHFQKI